MSIVLNGLSDARLRATGEPVGTPILKYPFLKDGDTQTKIIERRYWLYANVRNTPQIDSSLDKETASLFSFGTNDMFLCEESEPVDVGCGIVEIVRTFANVPQTRKVRIPQAVTLFGIDNTSNTIKENITKSCTITRYVNSYKIVYPARAVGSRILIKVHTADENGNALTDDSGNLIGFETNVYRTPTSATEVYDIDFIGYSVAYGGSVNMHKIMNIYILDGMASRNPKSTTVDGYVTYRYVKLNNPYEKITLPFPFEESNGNSVLSTTTNPTIKEYAQMVQNGDVYQSAPATVSMWLGNIAEIQIPYVYAM